MLKSFRNVTMISMQSLRVMPQGTKFGWIVNISRLSEIAKSNLNFQTLLSTIFSKKRSLQARITQEIVNSWYFLCVPNETKYYQKKGVDKKTLQLEFEDDGKRKEYEVGAICNSAVYVRELESGQLPGLYYLISWKSFLEDENTWKPVLAIQYLRRLVSIFHKEYADKSTANSLPIDLAIPMAKLNIRPEARNNKRKQGRQAKASSTRKRSKN